MAEGGGGEIEDLRYFLRMEISKHVRIVAQSNVGLERCYFSWALLYVLIETATIADILS